MRCAEPVFLWALLAVMPAVTALFYWSWRVKQKLMRQFISSRLLEGLTVGLSYARQKFRIALLIAAVAGIMLALARPQWGFVWQEAKQQGLDIIIALDTSRSMLARDVAPDRLDKAKLAAFDLMEQAKHDRLGIIAFAGTAFLQTPLTFDDQAFRQGIDSITVGIIPEGGTSLTAAIQTAMGAFEKENNNHKVLVLFTDGEDHDADKETLAAAAEAAKQGMRIFTVGVGTPEGELLRVTDQSGQETFINDENGNAVKSRLNKTLLQQIATEANGFYLPLQGADPMKTLYDRGLAPLPKTEESTRMAQVYQERFYWPLSFAILFLIVEFLLPESPRPRRTEPSAPAVGATTQKILTTLCLLLVPLLAHASPSSAFKDYQSGDFKSSLNEYSRLAEENTNDYRLHYDAGTAAYRARQLETAEKEFNHTLSDPAVTPDLPTQEKTYYNLGNTLYEMGKPLPEPDKKQELWQHSIENYAHALTLNTNDLEAKNNLAFVKNQLEELKKQQQKQQQQQNKQQQNKNDQNKDQQNQQDQKDQQAQQDQKNQQGGKGKKQQQEAQKSEEQKQKEAEQKKQQEQAQKDKDKEKQQQEAKANPTDKRDQSPEDAQQVASAGQMTPEEARQLLESQKDDAKSLIFAPQNQEVKTQPGKFKDW